MTAEKYQLTDTRDGKVIWTGHAQSPEQAMEFLKAEKGWDYISRELLKAEVVSENGTANSGVESGEKEVATHETGAAEQASPKSRKPRKDKGVTRNGQVNTPTGTAAKSKPVARIRAKGKFYVFERPPVQVLDSREDFEEYLSGAMKRTPDVSAGIFTIVQGRAYKVQENRQYKLIPE